jgi:RNA polymerase sigma factor (sigma-70 family)
VNDKNMEEIFTKHAQTVYKYLYSMTRNEHLSEELTQETFAIAVSSINRFRGECKISVWLCQIAKYQWYKELERRKKYKMESIDIYDNSLFTAGFENEIEFKDVVKILLEELESLDPATQEVIRLRIFGNMSYKEIGEVLGKTENWARVTFYRGKLKLKERMEKDEGQS